MNVRHIIPAAIVLAVSLTGCGSQENPGSSLAVDRATWTDGEWPFTVDRGILGCDKTKGESVTFTTPDGTTYGINGTALDHGFADVAPIWRDDPSPYTGPKVSVGGMIGTGKKLCDV